ncbi:MAG: type II toxin-antitoxin system RelE/ParE family toxin [Erythrobacter sp.]|nr:type II toxin-antitoxin system RelE/ParE family toxin [Erythrobacter sp.]
MRLVFTEKARADLRGIAMHIARDDYARALSFTEELRIACAGLRDFPRRFPVATHFADTEVRRRLHDDYLIYYRIENDTVAILRIVHGSIDMTVLQN